MKCRFGCNDPPIVRVRLEAGCVCFPDDKEQLLCAQHLVCMTPLGDWSITEVFDDRFDPLTERFRLITPVVEKAEE